MAITTTIHYPRSHRPIYGEALGFELEPVGCASEDVAEQRLSAEERPPEPIDELSRIATAQGLANLDD